MTLSPRLAEFERAAAAFRARAEGVPRRAARRLDRAAHGVVAAVRRGEPGARRLRLLHPYFGSMSIVQVVRLSAVHTRHHAANLPADRWSDRSEAAPQG